MDDDIWRKGVVLVVVVLLAWLVVRYRRRR